MAVPGLIDCHNHFVLMGNRPGHHTPLENAASIADVQALYATRAKTLPASPQTPVSADNFITTIGGFSPNQFKEVRLPTLAELDAAVPHQPVFIMVGFTGPAVTNSLGKAFFDNVTGPYPVAVGADGSIAASPFEGDGPATAALLALRQTLTLDDRKRSVRDAMAYSASVGVTTHLDQGAFQATNTPADGSAHDNNYTMYDSFLSVYEEGNQRDVEDEQQGIVRLRTNYLLFDTETTIPVATARLENAFPFFGSDLVRTGAVGEFLADISLYAGGNPVWMNAALLAAKAGWRAEVHSLSPTDFQTEIQGYEAVNEQVPITDFRWVVAHVPFITADYVARLKALGGGVNLTSYEYFEAGQPGRAAVPDAARQRHPGRAELGRHADRAAEPVDPRLLRDHRHQRARRPGQSGSAADQDGGARALHPGEPLVPRRRRRGPARHARGGQARGRGRAERRLLRGLRR